MRRAVLVLLTLLTVTSAVHAGEWHVLDGKQAPPLTINAWLNHGEATPSNESLKGRVWLLQFMAVH
jgi:hypothetical protein